MSAPNVQQIIGEYITATGTSLYSLIATRAWHSAYPQQGSGSGQWPDGTAGIVYTVVSEDPPANGQTNDVTVEFRCHGANRTYSAAQAVARALHDRLHCAGGSTASGRINRAYRTGGQDLTDPSTGWPFTLARYVMHVQP